MKFLLSLYSLCFLTLNTWAQDAASSYTVQEGDSPAKIAAALHIKLKDLLAANPGLNPKTMQIGQQLALPAAASVPAAADAAIPAEDPANVVPAAPATKEPALSGKTYAVKKGDTPERIARRLKIKLDDFLAANPGIDATGLQIGQKLQVPARH